MYVAVLLAGEIIQCVSQGLRPVWPPDCFPHLEYLGKRCLAHHSDERPTFTEIVKEIEDMEVRCCAHVGQRLAAPRLALAATNMLAAVTYPEGCINGHVFACCSCQGLPIKPHASITGSCSLSLLPCSRPLLGLPYR